MKIKRSEVREPVGVFALCMESRLKDKDEDNKLGWEGCTIRYLLDEMEMKKIDLDEALNQCNPDMVQKKCLDIANYMMMIHDKLDKMREQQ